MSRVKVKICGITSPEDLTLAVDVGADALGFVVDVPESPRDLSIAQAKDLVTRVPVSVESVVVTVFRSIDRLEQICRELRPNAIQLHGAPALSPKIRRKLPRLRMIGAFSVNSDSQLVTTIHWVRGFDAVLVDTFDAERIGGTGKTHDWNVSRQVREKISPTPLILAGGLTSHNVKEATGIVKPYAVDVSSGVENAPGRKDRNKLFSFIRNAKEVEL